MPHFAYKAMMPSGATESGRIEAASVDAAGEILLERGLVPTDVREEAASFSLPSLSDLRSRHGRVPAMQVILFTKQFATMMRAGMPMMRLLQVLEEQTENHKLRAAVKDIAEGVQKGESLHSAFRRYDAIFSPLYADMVNAGEASGSLPEVMERLIYLLEHEHKIRSEVRSACRYPLIVVSMLVMAFFVLLTFVIPKFAKLFENAGVQLPLPTRICLGLYHMLGSYWAFLAIGVAAVVFGTRFALKTNQGRYVRDLMLLRLPILGSLMRKAAMSRFASIFAILQTSGVGILDTLQILRTTINNEAIGREFERVTQQLVEGRGIAAPLRSARFFPPMVVNMVAVGEESGSLDMMLREVASHYDAEVEFATKGLAESLGPLLTVGLAVVVGFFALSIFLPMWDLYKIAQ